MAKLAKKIASLCKHHACNFSVKIDQSNFFNVTFFHQLSSADDFQKSLQDNDKFSTFWKIALVSY
jgi:hypothetical protein